MTATVLDAFSLAESYKLHHSVWRYTDEMLPNSYILYG